MKIRKVVVTVLFVSILITTILIFYKNKNEIKKDDQSLSEKATIMQIPYHDLTEIEMKELKAKVKRGDALAARRIANYYDFSVGDMDSALIWLKKAGELGDQNSLKAVHYLLRNKTITYDSIPSPDLE